MSNANGLFDDFDTDSREKDRSLGIKLMLPAFFLIVLPLFYFVAMSVHNGRDEFGPLRDFLNHYHVALLIPLIACLACLCVSIYLIVIKDITEPFRHNRNY